jgi:hypothetical protein
MSPLRWTTSSTRDLADELTRQGHKVSADTVGDLLRAVGFSLQGNAKTIEGTRHPDRDAQFRYINEQVKACQGAGDPVISVDTKKKELVGEFKNAGREWRPKGQPTATSSPSSPRPVCPHASPVRPPRRPATPRGSRKRVNNLQALSSIPIVLFVTRRLPGAGSGGGGSQHLAW